MARPLQIVLWAVLAGFLGLNVLAYRHAHRMLHYAYAPAGTRTAPPETLAGLAKWRVLVNGVTLPRPEDNRPPTVLAPDAREEILASTGGIRLSAWVAARGETAPLVLLFHGYSTEKTRLLTEARMLYALGASVVLVDFRGSGGSSAYHTTLGVEEADDVAAAVAHVRAQHPHAALYLYGQSMGSAAILRAIRVHGLKPDGVILEAVFDRMLQAIRNRFRAMGVPSFPAAELLTFWGGWQQGFNAFAHNPVDDAQAMTCPALFLHGADDPRARPEEARRVAAAAGGPVRWVLFENVGHGSYAARHPDIWQQELRTFLGL